MVSRYVVADPSVQRDGVKCIGINGWKIVDSYQSYATDWFIRSSRANSAVQLTLPTSLGSARSVEGSDSNVGLPPAAGDNNLP